MRRLQTSLLESLVQNVDRVIPGQKDMFVQKRRSHHILLVNQIREDSFEKLLANNVRQYL